MPPFDIQIMSSLCWPNVSEKIVRKENELAKIRYLLVFAGLWSVNILIVLFGLPVLIFIRAKDALRSQG